MSKDNTPWIGWIGVTCLIVLGTGCSSSRWAMSDPVYAEHYDKPYEGSGIEKIGRMAKQSVDARFLSGRTGSFVSMGLQPDPFHLGGSVGKFGYSNPYVSGHLGLSGFLSSTAEGAFVGAETGFRMQSPTRLAPFVGVGGLLGMNWNEVSSDDECYHDDCDEDQTDWYVGIYPELGVHFWLTPRYRLTGSATYNVTTEGRNSDFWNFGLSFSYLSGPSTD